MRLAWFTPWPPQPSGIAGRSAELVPRLAARDHAIDVFVDERGVPLERVGDDAPAAGEVRVSSAHDFVWRHAKQPYDLVVYQVGNSRLHAFVWPYLFRWPGLVVLHDARLHHARGHAMLSQNRTADYRAEFRWNHPEAADGFEELAVRGYAGVYYYEWPMTRAVLASARLVAVHARGARAELAPVSPADRPIVHIALGSGRRDLPTEAARRATRASWCLPADAIVFGVFGGLTADKRVEPILRAFAAARARAPQARLVLGGAVDSQLDLSGLLDALALGDVVTILGPLGDDDFEDAVAAVDVSLNLRWPTALEVSGPWLQALAAGRPTVIVDHAHLSDVPTLDPRTWRRHAPGPESIEADAAAVAVAVDILDEEHSLRMAIEMLAADPRLRARLGATARRYWEREHTVERMTDDYQRAMARAAAMPPPSVDLPAHLRPDALAHAKALLDPFGAGMLSELA